MRPGAGEHAREHELDGDGRGDGQRRARPAFEKPERDLADDQHDGDQDGREVALVDAEGVDRPVRSGA